MKTLLAAAVLSTAMVVPAYADRVQLGVLDCKVSGGAGFIVGSSKGVACTFRTGEKAPEAYVGSISKFGLDVGVTTGSVIKWVVYGTSDGTYAPGALAGSYGGVSAEATAAFGAGANALVGGSGRNFVLQPVSLQGQRGLNLAVGVSSFKLRTVQG